MVKALSKGRDRMNLQFRTLRGRFMRNRLSLETAGRGVRKFIVDEPHSWMETILEQKRDVN